MVQDLITVSEIFNGLLVAQPHHPDNVGEQTKSTADPEILNKSYLSMNARQRATLTSHHNPRDAEG